MNRHFWIVHLVVIGLVALAFATVSTRIVETRLNKGLHEVAHPTQRSSKPLKRQTKRRSDYAVILKKNIFHAVVEEPPPGEKPPASKPDPSDQAINLAKTPLNVKLQGTAVRDGGDSFAVIQDRRGRKQDLYRIGDMILGEAKLVQIFQDRVVLLREGKKEILELSVEEKTSRAPPKRMASSGGPSTVAGRGVRRLGSNRWSISREEMESAKSNLSQLMTEVRIVPNFTDEKPDGFKLLSIKRGSLLNRLGLRNGDVVRRINGVSLDDPQKAIEVYQGLEGGQSISVEILRGGREQTLNYDLK